MTPVPVLLEFVDHDGKGGRPSVVVVGTVRCRSKQHPPPLSASLRLPVRNRCLHLIKCTEVPAGVHNMMLGPPREPRPYHWGNPAAPPGPEPNDAELRRLWRTGSMRAA